MTFQLHTILFNFTFYYPIFMAYVWIVGGIVYFLRYERTTVGKEPLKRLTSTPLVSIIVPCYNEADNVRDVVDSLSKLNYPNYEIICVNDGSKDDTGAVLDELLPHYPMLRVIHQAKNQGKAVGLNTAAVVAKGEFLLCIDGDAVVDHNAISWMLWHFETSSRVAAVTGNPRVRTRSSLLGRIQVGEFSSIIGLTKRAQRVYGTIFTVSGVLVMFRRRALMEVDFWSPDMLTEDIDISWKLQSRNWDIRFEPNAVCWVLMPETLRGLWKQRLRWSMGGIQVIRKYSSVLLHWDRRRLWPVYCEYVTSVLWAYAMGSVIVLWLIGMVVPLPIYWQTSVIPRWHGLMLGLTCLMQFLVSMSLDYRYDQKLFRQFNWLIWYPLAYWMISMCTTITAVPRILLRKKGQRAVWVSPDRGLQSLGTTAKEVPMGDNRPPS